VHYQFRQVVKIIGCVCDEIFFYSFSTTPLFYLVFLLDFVFFNISIIYLFNIYYYFSS
jgi:hypothetical protein